MKWILIGLLLSCHVEAVPDTVEQITQLRQRLVPVEGQSAYQSAKAEAWLEFAYEEYIERDYTGIVDDTLQKARQLVSCLEQKKPECAESAQTSERVREDLWERLEHLKDNGKTATPENEARSLTRCAGHDVGRAEVMLVRAAHEWHELGPRHARRYVNEAEQLIRAAEIACLPPH
jgi:hypothetical protein